MITFRTKSPYCIVLITTFRCNAACAECCFGCRPGRGRTMTLDEMRHYVDVCMDAWPDSITHLSLTGGECFLLGRDLDEIIRHGSSKGLSVGFVSNGYWGGSYQAAKKRVLELRECGLKDICFSIGNDHQHLLPLRNCRNAVTACARAGYKVELRMESTSFGKCGIYNKLEHDAAFMKLVRNGMIGLKFWEWKEYNNEVVHGRSNAWRIRPYGKSERCDSLFRNIVVTPYGDVLACSGIGGCRNPHMRLGNIWKESVRTLYERTYADVLKIWIGMEGPQAVLQYVYDNSNIRFHKTGNGCDACIEIFENPKILPFLREHYDDWAKKILYY